MQFHEPENTLMSLSLQSFKNRKAFPWENKGEESKNLQFLLSKTSTVISNFCESQKIDNNLSKGKIGTKQQENKSESILAKTLEVKCHFFSVEEGFQPGRYTAAF